MTQATGETPWVAAGQALPQLEPQVAEAHAALYGRHIGPLAWGSSTLALSFMPGEVPQAGLQMLVDCGGHALQVQLADPRLLTDFGSALSPQLPEAFQLAAVTHLIKPLKDRLSAHLQQRVELNAVNLSCRPWSAESSLGIQLTTSTRLGDTLRTSAQLRPVRSESWPWLVKTLLGAVRPLDQAEGPDPALLISLFAGTVVLPAAELSTLQTGDVVLLDAAASSRRYLSIQLRAGSRRTVLATGVLGDRVVEITALPEGLLRVTRYRFPRAERYTMQEFDPESPLPSHAPEGDAPGVVDFDKLQVELEIEAGRLSLPLSAVRALAVGQVFSSDAPAHGRNVVLWCGGQPVALGELLVVGERLGVRIASLTLSPARADAHDPADTFAIDPAP